MSKWIQQLINVGAEAKISLIEKAFWNDALRPVAIRQLQKHILEHCNHFLDSRRPARAAQDRADLLNAIFSSVQRTLDEHLGSRTFLKNGIRSLISSSYLEEEDIEAIRARFAQRHGGHLPPGTIVLSPSKACNLRCSGCYANADPGSADHLSWDLFDRLITEAKTLWGVRFFTISGGEPFAYRSQGKGLLDAVAKHSDCFFMVYTNGTLLDRKTAERIAELGNLTPAISVEGRREATDRRRGQGVFQRILDAMQNLRTAGVPFGVSLTATRLNAEELFSDSFIDFLFNEQKATYGWVFQYMPIGRGYTLDLLPTPEQRLWMWRRTWEIIRQREIFIADFWNCGTVSDGCIAAATDGGYLYIDWNGKVMPCVFVPYAATNIHKLYAAGKTLDDIYELPYFKGIRDWQSGYAPPARKPEETGNWLLACSFRDHYEMGHDLVCRCHAQPEDQAAAEALNDKAYVEGMKAYDQALHRVFDPVWEQEYLRRSPSAESLVQVESNFA